MKKELSVVFPIYEFENKTYILMGKQAPGKKLAGFRNGYGGKCEPGESTLFCAKRELEEELKLGEKYRMHISCEDFEKVGTVLQDDKQIDFFIVRLSDMILPPTDNSEFVNTAWFDIEEKEKFVPEMLSGDDEVIASLTEYLKTKKEVEINKTGNQELERQTKNIYK